MSFKSQLDDDAVNVFLNTDEFAESLVYTPYAGTPVTIKAIIVRERIDPGSEDHGRILQNQSEIYIANDADEGITSVDKGRDKVSFPKLVGGTAVDWSVVDVLSKDDGMWHLLVQK